MSVIRGQEQELRRVVSQASHEAGLRALLELARIDRDKALTKWRVATGTDLVKYQTEYNAAQGTIDYITKPPREFAQSNTGEES